MASPAAAVGAQQRRWATRRGIKFDEAGYTLALDDNLFAPLSPETRGEFERGDGAELPSDGKRGKMQALHSSSALACNIFDYWRHRDLSALTEALSAPAGIEALRFEQKRPTGLPGNPPNLDLVLSLSDGSELAIESKFLEPWGSRHAAGFKRKYFESSVGEWERHGYSASQRLAEALSAGTRAFRWLHVEQLLKHILGLARGEKPWHLVYLWYAPDCPAAIEHAVEVRDFTSVTATDGISFCSITYQDLFAAMKAQGHERHDGYFRYLESRYFARWD